MFSYLARCIVFFALLGLSASGYATQYPLTVTDISGQSVTIAHEPRRVVLQDGRDIMALALLDRTNPFQRLVAWNNIPKRSDVATWNMLKTTWPQADKVLDMGFGDDGEVNLESMLAQKPDLLIAQLRAKAALSQSGVIDKLHMLGIPVLFVDYEVNPVKNTAASIDLLGEVLNKDDNAKAYTAFYRQQLDAIQRQTSHLPRKANVFVEALAGRSDSCCFTHAHNGWGALVEAVGARNIGSTLLTGAAGYVSLEKLISMRPDVYIMTGTRHNSAENHMLPLGYDADQQAIKQTAAALLARNGVSEIPAVRGKRVFGIYHQFYNHPYNIVGMEYLAKAIYPQQFAALNPAASYHYLIRHFTRLPDRGFIFASPLAE
ncbi:ABC transporter substrate-binding protein [Martelella alba]|uniref:ABC transporter substrate-binding protein n=1 Tax=Martelella alba TaxID=2590451 RepID=A0ABY2SJM3_9HYPH|nr:ABC transporter substrate-binding protein [Martelella alba]TKI05693.1 ABC transporter substrate-binding protein [Martelella alba]